jgi:NTP pyrophosphatase (non-canonical NTP hydrolase)
VDEQLTEYERLVTEGKAACTPDGYHRIKAKAARIRARYLLKDEIAALRAVQERGAQGVESLKTRWQEPLAEWQERELPCEDVARQKLRLALGAAEECGEVARCVLKGDQGIRGGAAVWKEKLGGELGDVVVYLIQLASAEGLDFEACVDGSIRKVLARRFATKGAGDVEGH